MQDASGVDLSAFAAGTSRPARRSSRSTDELRRRRPPLHADAAPAHAADARPAGEAAAADPGRHGPARRRGPRAADAPRRRERRAARHPHAAAGQAPKQRFVFEDVAAPPVPSLLRGFSAPVKLARPAARPAALPGRARHRPVHPLGRRPAIRRRGDARHGRRAPPRRAARLRPGAAPRPSRANLAGADADPAFAAEALPLPSEGFLADQMAVADPEAIHAGPPAPAPPRSARALRRRAARDLRQAGRCRPLQPRRRRHRPARAAQRLPRLPRRRRRGRRAPRPGAVRRRRQHDRRPGRPRRCSPTSEERGATRRSPPSTPAGAATTWCWTSGSPSRPCRRAPGTAAKVRALQSHPDFSLRNPNRARSLIGAFASGNPRPFPRPLGRGLSASWPTR